MKKIGIALVALLALSFAFVSCDADPNEVLDKDDITKDWVEGCKWDGVETLDLSGDTSTCAMYEAFFLLDGIKKGDNEVTDEEFSVAGLQSVIEMDGKTKDDLLGTTKYSTVVKSNKKRNKLYIEQISEVEISGAKATITMKGNYTKQK